MKKQEFSFWINLFCGWEFVQATMCVQVLTVLPKHYRKLNREFPTCGRTTDYFIRYDICG